MTQLPAAAEPSQEVRQPNTNEAPQTEQKSEKKLSPQFAALARKERAIQKRLQEMDVREKAFQARESEYASGYVRKDQIADLLVQDPSALGLDLGRLTNLVLNQKPEDAELRALKAQIKALEDSQNKVTSKMEEQKTQAYEQAVKQIRNEAKILIESDPSEYETIREMKAEEAVVELIRQTFDEEEILMSVEDAAKEVESYLSEEAFRMSQLNKVKKRLTPAVEESIPQGAPTKTLTNAHGASSKQLTPRERAILAFNGQLK